MASGEDIDVQVVAERMWGMLDKLYANNPQEYDKFVSQQLEEGSEPGFCLRCNATEKNCRLYINVCKWTRIPKPKTEQDPIPVKGGILRHVVQDKKRTKSLVLDIAFNPSVLEECLSMSDMEGMLVSLCLDFVRDFIPVDFDRKSCKKLPNCKFVGSRSDMHYSLEDTFKDLLSTETKLDVGDAILNQLNAKKTTDKKECSGELPPLKLLPSSSPPSKKLIEELSSKTAAGRDGSGWIEPGHSMTVREGDARHPCRRVVVKATLPGVSSVAQVELEVSREELELRSVDGGLRYRLALRLAVPVDEEQTRAAFSTRTSVLTVTMPCSPDL